MAHIGYKLSSEEFGPAELIRFARAAEDAGFEFALISDHFHPWTDRQGQSPFVWTVLGALAQATERLSLGTAVTCPTIRLHPAIVAQAAATTAVMLPGRFFLGVGSGEHLNEHILGDRWPSNTIRLEMLEEAIGVMRQLWEGGLQSHRGRYYEVQNARVYTVPPVPPPIMVAAGGPKAAGLAGRLGDGLVVTSPQRAVLDAFRAAGGAGKPCYGELTVCWAENERDARRTALVYWPISAMASDLNAELPLPSHFEGAAKSVTEDQLAEVIVCGPDARKHLEAVRKYVDAGIDHVFVHQVGPDQDGFLRFYQREILPQVRDLRAAA